MNDAVPQSDHDLLIRLDEKVTTIARKQDEQHLSNAQLLTSISERMTQFEKRLEDLELWRATQRGVQVIMLRTASVISSVIGSVVAALIVYFFTQR